MVRRTVAIEPLKASHLTRFGCPLPVQTPRSPLFARSCMSLASIFRGGIMGAVDFARFVDELADASGDAILPFFRSHFGAEDKNKGGAFDPVTEADRAAET